MPIELLHPSWHAHPRVRACVTTRFGGISEGRFAELNLSDRVADTTDHVIDNRSRLEALTGPVQWLEQCHGNQVIEVGHEIRHPPPPADAAWTRVPGRVLGVLTADCFPVFMADAEGSLVAVAHCGWKPLTFGILGNLVRAMPARAEALTAWIGPGIGRSKYQVGENFLEVIRTAVPNPLLENVITHHSGQTHASLERLIRNQLKAMGVSASSDPPPCTFGDDRFFSHRRDGPRTGRFASLIWIDAKA